ncbi:isopeptide-forming domain-containing fimbrial protein, partial [Brevundimonas sp. UBA5713]|uniref:isopeptide-forming domain-containing fimbrial protein n=1 Tax=Brevundimonas sp. UBA5713 TaxID=1946130 RepID=UPI0032E46799
MSSAIAQTSVSNAARIIPPASVLDPNLGNNDASATVNVTPLPIVTFSKSNNATTVSVDQTIRYTVSVNIERWETLNPLTLTDQIGSGLGNVSLVSTGPFSCTENLVCTLPAGTAAGTYTIVYEATVLPSALGSVTNRVTGSGGDNPSCSGSCETTNPLADPSFGYSKSADASGPVKVGDTITYTLRGSVRNSQLTLPAVLTDSLPAGLTFGAVVDAGGYTCNDANPLQCTLPAGTVPGVYDVVFSATVNDQATGQIVNTVTATGNNPECEDCTVITPVTDPSVRYAKTADATGSVKVGDTITYTLTAEVLNAQLTEVFTLTDT